MLWFWNWKNFNPTKKEAIKNTNKNINAYIPEMNSVIEKLVIWLMIHWPEDFFNYEETLKFKPNLVKIIKEEFFEKPQFDEVSLAQKLRTVTYFILTMSDKKLLLNALAEFVIGSFFTAAEEHYGKLNLDLDELTSKEWKIRWVTELIVKGILSIENLKEKIIPSDNNEKILGSLYLGGLDTMNVFYWYAVEWRWISKNWMTPIQFKDFTKIITLQSPFWNNFAKNVNECPYEDCKNMLVWKLNLLLQNFKWDSVSKMKIFQAFNEWKFPTWQLDTELRKVSIDPKSLNNGIADIWNYDELIDNRRNQLLIF